MVIKKKCEVCNSTNVIIFQKNGKINIEKKRYGPLSVSICVKCGYKFLSPRLSDKDYKNYFKINYGKTFHGFKDKFQVRKLNLQKKRGQKVFDFITKKKLFHIKGNILDYGCSTGITLLPWKERFNTYGFDPHLPSIEHGKKTYNLKLKCQFGENLNYKDNFFNNILILGSIEHALNLNKCFKEIKRILKPNGYIFIRYRKYELEGSPLEYFNSSTIRYFTRFNWLQILKKFNLRLVKFINTPVEGYETFEYLLVKNSNFKICSTYKSYKKKFSYSLQRKYYNNYFQKYEKLCQLINKSELIKKTIFIKKKFIKKYNIKLMYGIGTELEAINRFILETKRYLLFRNKI